MNGDKAQMLPDCSQLVAGAGILGVVWGGGGGPGRAALAATQALGFTWPYNGFLQNES